MTRAHTAWRALSPRKKATYDRMAKEHADQRVMSIAETARAHAEQVRLRRDRLIVERCTDFGPPRLGTCRWTDQDMATMTALEQSTHFSSQRVCDLRALAVLPVERPSDLELTELAAAGAPTFPKDGDVYPSWAIPVCANRDEFASVAFLVYKPGRVEIFDFMYAKTNPRHLTLAILADASCGGAGSAPGGDSNDEEERQWEFRVTPEFSTEYEVGSPIEESMFGSTQFCLRAVRAGVVRQNCCPLHLSCIPI